MENRLPGLIILHCITEICKDIRTLVVLPKIENIIKKVNMQGDGYVNSLNSGNPFRMYTSLKSTCCTL